MMNLIKTEVPTNVNGARFKNGVLVSYSMPGFQVLLIGHEDREFIGASDKEADIIKKTVAFEICVPHPVTRARAITAAEMSVYGLITPLDVASFNAGLSRKSREQVDLEEIEEHDKFIAWVKAELTKIGV